MNIQVKLEKKSLHIISFNIPYPANYGGVIDVFYKIKALKSQGINIILHAFEYGRKPADELEKHCAKVHYYHRSLSLSKQLSTLPFIVKTRDVNTLLQNLKKDNHPILFEGLHTCYFLNHPDLAKRKKYIRMHNVEWQYYAHLAKVESNLFKKTYFKLESEKLRCFENKIKNVDGILAISKIDKEYFEKKYPNISTHYIPAFHPNKRVDIKVGKGKYILFHGDLSVKDNERAAIFLLEKVVHSVDYQFIIAGLNPSDKLISQVILNENANLYADLSNEGMENLIKNAHVNILLSFQSAGMKLKLLNALFKGRFCVVNDFMVKNTGLEDLCFVGKTAEDFQKILIDVFEKKFSVKGILERRKRLEVDFSNEKLAEQIKQIAFT
ncbi:MAG: glycosyltransferase [Saprospiraceae bacterium]